LTTIDIIAEIVVVTVEWLSKKKDGMRESKKGKTN